MNDEERAIELTGGSARTLAEALDQWELEQVALGELFDENQALTISFRRYDVTMIIARTIIDQIEAEAAMFITEKTRNKIEQFREQMQLLEAYRADNRITTTAARERQRQRRADHVQAT